MPRYTLDACAPPPCNAAAATAAANSATRSPEHDFGVFRFDGYAVSIRMDDRGMRAERLVKHATSPGPLHALLYWLKTLFKAEGGASWYLNKRDSNDVIGQRWAQDRQRHLRSFTTSAPPQLPQSTQSTQSPRPPTDLPALACAEAAWTVVLGCLNSRDRAAIGLTSKRMQYAMHGELALQGALARARGLRTLEGLQKVAADYGLDTGQQADPTRADRLMPGQKEALVVALAERIPMLEGGRHGAALDYLCRQAAGLEGRTGLRVRAALLMSLPKEQREKAAAVLLPDKAAYAALIRSQTPQEQRERLVAITEAFLHQPGTAEPAVSRWDELLADARGDLLARPALAGRQLFALATCLKKIARPGGNDDRELLAAALDRWHALRQQLPALPATEAVELAYALSRRLERLEADSVEWAKAVALLDAWQASVKLTCEQQVRLLARLAHMKSTEGLAKRWSAVWDRIETGQLGHLGAQAARELAWVPAQEGWQRVVNFCMDDRKASPNQRADMLLALVQFVEMRRFFFGQLDVKALKPELHQAAMKLMESGGPVFPLLRCQWRPKAETAAAIRKHLDWPRHCEALVQWLEYRGHRDAAPQWSLSDLLALQPDLARLVERIVRDGDGATGDAGERVAMAVAAWADTQIVSQQVEPALALAEALRPLVQATCRHDRGGAALPRLAQLINSIILVANEQPDIARAGRIDALFEATWALADALPPADRRAMLDALIMLKEPLQPNEIRRTPQFWAGRTLLRAAQAISDDMPGRANLLVGLAKAEYMLDGQSNLGAHFGSARMQIHLKTVALPDREFAVAAERLALWFAGRPADRAEARAWEKAKSAFLARVRGLSVEHHMARQRIEHWMEPEW